MDEGGSAFAGPIPGQRAFSAGCAAAGRAWARLPAPGPDRVFRRCGDGRWAAAFLYPEGVRWTRAGNVYVPKWTATSGEGDGPPAALPPSCVTTLGGLFGFNGPDGRGVDGSGNVYVAGSRQQRTVGGDARRLRFRPVRHDAGRVASSYPLPWRWTGSGNVYVADNTNAVKEMPPAVHPRTTPATSARSRRWAAASSIPREWRWTGAGNVYVADTYNNAVKEMPAGCTFRQLHKQPRTITTLGGGFKLSPMAWR